MKLRWYWYANLSRGNLYDLTAGNLYVAALVMPSLEFFSWKHSCVRYKFEGLINITVKTDCKLGRSSELQIYFRQSRCIFLQVKRDFINL